MFYFLSYYFIVFYGIFHVFLIRKFISMYRLLVELENHIDYLDVI